MPVRSSFWRLEYILLLQQNSICDDQTKKDETQKLGLFTFQLQPTDSSNADADVDTSDELDRYR